MNSPIFKWTTYEYAHKNRSNDWYWAIGLISIGASVVAFLNNNFLFGVFIIICGGSFIIISKKKPEPLSCEVFVDGIQINHLLYPYDKIKHFYINKNTNKLFMLTSRLVMPLIIMPIDEVDTDELHLFLKDHIEEKETEEPFSHRLIDAIGL